MFSLIITIISIALVAALALATLYYGGDAFNQGKAGAEASRLINEGQQLNAAVTLAKATGVTAVNWEDLVDNDMLSQLPSVFELDGTAAIGTASVATTGDVCLEIEKRAQGDSTITAVATAKQSDRVYGCYGSGTAFTFFYEAQ